MAQMVYILSKGEAHEGYEVDSVYLNLPDAKKAGDVLASLPWKRWDKWNRVTNTRWVRTNGLDLVMIEKHQTRGK